MNHGRGIPRGARELGDVRDVALDQLESRMTEELGDRLPSVHQPVEDADLVPAVQEQTDGLAADVAGAAEHHHRPMAMRDQRRDERPVSGERERDERPREDDGRGDDQPPQDDARHRGAEDEAAHRRRPDRADQHHRLPPPARDPEARVEAREPVPQDEEDGGEAERRGLPQRDPRGDERRDEQQRCDEARERRADVEQQAGFIGPERGQRPSAGHASPDPFPRRHDRLMDTRPTETVKTRRLIVPPSRRTRRGSRGPDC